MSVVRHKKHACTQSHHCPVPIHIIPYQTPPTPSNASPFKLNGLTQPVINMAINTRFKYQMRLSQLCIEHADLGCKEHQI